MKKYDGTLLYRLRVCSKCEGCVGRLRVCRTAEGVQDKLRVCSTGLGCAVQAEGVQSGRGYAARAWAEGVQYRLRIFSTGGGYAVQADSELYRMRGAEQRVSLTLYCTFSLRTAHRKPVLHSLSMCF